MVAQSEQNLIPQEAQLATGVPPHQHKILFPVDFSGRSTEAVRHVRFWASRFGSRIFAVHVVGPVEYIGQPYQHQDWLTENLPSLEWKAKQTLESFCEQYLREVVAHPVVRVGSKVEELIRFAETEQVDLIMLPRDHQSLTSRILHDSLTAKILQRCSISVWTTEHLHALSRIEIRHILCAVHVAADLQLDAGMHYLLKSARLVAETFGASLSLLYVGNPEFVSERLQQIRQEMGADVRYRTETGDIAESIERVAKETEADLLMVGRTRPQTVGLGVQGHILRLDHLLRCPVLSVG